MYGMLFIMIVHIAKAGRWIIRSNILANKAESTLTLRWWTCSCASFEILCEDHSAFFYIVCNCRFSLPCGFCFKCKEMILARYNLVMRNIHQCRTTRMM